MKDKKIKDTALGAWLKTKVPALAEKVGDLLPDSGVLGVVKNLVDKEPDVSMEDKLEFEKLKQQQEVEARCKACQADSTDHTDCADGDVHADHDIRQSGQLAVQRKRQLHRPVAGADADCLRCILRG